MAIEWNGVELFCKPWWDGVVTYQSKRVQKEWELMVVVRKLKEGDEFFGMVLWNVLRKKIKLYIKVIWIYNTLMKQDKIG